MENKTIIASMYEYGMVAFGKDYPVKGVKIKSPFGLFFQKMANIPGFYDNLALKIEKEIPDKINCIAGLGYEGIVLGYLIARHSGRMFVALQESKSSQKLAGFEDTSPLRGKNIAIIPGIIATGNSIADGLDMIQDAGGLCNVVYPIFDYGFYLKSALSHFTKRDLKICPVVTSRSLQEYLIATGNANGYSISKWISSYPNYFREGVAVEKQLV